MTKLKYMFLLSILFLVIASSGVLAVRGFYPNCGANKNIVACYHFNTNDVIDSSQFGSNGSNVGAYYNSSGGFLGDGAFEFNGTNLTYLTINDSKQLSPSNYPGFTVSLWVRFNSLTAPDGSTQMPVAKSKVSNYEWDMRKSSDNRGFAFNIATPAGLTNCEADTSGDYIDPGIWYNVVGVYYNNTNCSIYYNGAQSYQTIIANTSNIPTDKSANLTIGLSGDGNHTFNGSVDELVVWNRSLSNNEIKELFINYSGCTIPTNKQNYKVDLNLCPGTYVLPDGITVGSNTILDCNDSTLIGNGTSGLKGILISTQNNTVIKNCKILNYDQGIYVAYSNNVTLYNVSINNSITTPIYLPYSNNSNISNSYINNGTSCIYFEGGVNNTISNNWFGSTVNNYCFRQVVGNTYGYTINNNTFTYDGFYYQYGTNINVSGNYFLNMNSSTATLYVVGMNNFSLNKNVFNGALNNKDGIWFDNVSNYVVYNNTFYNFSSSATTGSVFDIVITGYSKNGTIWNNIFNWTDTGIRLGKEDNLSIFNNTFDMILSGRDGYGSAIIAQDRFYRNSNIFIYNNTFFNIGGTAISFQGGQNIIIYNNNISYLPVSTLINYSFINAKTVPCGIEFVEEYLTWTGNNNEANTNNRTNLLGSYNSTGIKIYNNTFNSNTQCFYRFQGTTNYTNDVNMNNVWYINQQFPSYLFDTDEFYLNNNFNNISVVDTTHSPNPITHFITDLLGDGYMNDYIGKWRWNKNLSYYIYDTGKYNVLTNLLTTAPPTLQLLTYNITSPIIYYNNLLTRNLSLVNAQINFTLNPNQEVWIYNSTNFNTTRNWSHAILVYPNGTALNNGNFINGYYNINWDSTNMVYAYDNSNDLNVTYTLTYNTAEQNGYVGGTQFISNNVIGMIINFFALSPVIGSILAIAILIAIIIGVVIYIKRFSGTTEAGSFSG